jgi:hypothetical protein
MINEYAQYGNAPLELNSDGPAPLELNSESPAPLEQDVDGPAPLDLNVDGPAPSERNGESPAPLRFTHDTPAAPGIDRSYDDGVKSVLRVVGDVEFVGIARRMLEAKDATGLRCCLDEIERRLGASATR